MGFGPPTLRLAARALATGMLVAWSGPCGAEQLTELFARALQVNPAIASARAALEVAEAEIDGARTGLWRPEIELELDSTLEDMERRLQFAPDIEEQIFENSATLSVSVPLYDGGKTFADVKSANRTRDAALDTLAQAEQTVFFKIATAFGQMVMNGRLIAIGSSLLQENIRLEQRLASMRQRNLATETELLQAQSDVVDVETALFGFQTALRVARVTIESLAGRLDRDPQDYPRVNIPPTLDQAMDLAQTAHPSVRTAQFKLMAAEEAIDAARAGGRPSVAVSGGYVFKADEEHFSGADYVQHDSTRTLSLGLSITVPLYDAGVTSASVREAVGTVAKLRDDHRNARDTVVQKLRTAWLNQEKAHADMNFANRQIEERRKIYEQMLREFENQLGTLDELLRALENMQSAHQDWEQARLALFNAQMAILEATGRLTSASLGLSHTGGQVPQEETDHGGE